MVRAQWGTPLSRGDPALCASPAVPTWLFVPQLPRQVALVELLQMFGEPLVMGGAHGAHRLYPVGAVAAAPAGVITWGGQAGGVNTQDGTGLPSRPPYRLEGLNWR